MITLTEEYMLEKLSDKTGYNKKETKLKRMAKYTGARTVGTVAGIAAAGALGVGTIASGGVGGTAAMGAFYLYRKYKVLKLKAEKEKDKVKKKILLAKAKKLKQQAIKKSKEK